MTHTLCFKLSSWGIANDSGGKRDSAPSVNYKSEGNRFLLPWKFLNCKHFMLKKKGHNERQP